MTETYEQVVRERDELRATLAGRDGQISGLQEALATTSAELAELKAKVREVNNLWMVYMSNYAEKMPDDLFHLLPIDLADGKDGAK